MVNISSDNQYQVQYYILGLSFCSETKRLQQENEKKHLFPSNRKVTN